MKIKSEHFDYLKAAIEPIMARTPVAEYRAANPTFSDKRVRWDYLWAAKLSTWISDNLYSYMNDTHIDTALKAIVGV